MLEHPDMTHGLTIHLHQEVHVFWSPTEVEIVGSENINSPTKELFLFSVGQTIRLPDLPGHEIHEAATSDERKRFAVLARAFIASVSRSRGGALVTRE